MARFSDLSGLTKTWLDEDFENKKRIDGDDVFKNLVPRNIITNLNPKFELRPYQKEAFGRYIYYRDSYKGADKQNQVLFQMATGSGKTLIMAGLILYLYTKGYHNFVFFVNSTNIIEKTKDNFLNRQSNKYLFADNIVIDNENVDIKEVTNFQFGNNDDEGINICFSTIQKLHTDLWTTISENQLTLDDFKENKTVLIADEAHHINVDTKKEKNLRDTEKENKRSWELSVQWIFNANKDNLLLEFTATADLSNSLIANKYYNKLLFDYDLKQFRIDGYSKDVDILQADMEPFERSLIAVLLSQYRRKIFEKNGIHIKPVILFKSKSIENNKAFQEEFNKRLKNLTVADIETIKKSNQATILNEFFEFCKKENISFANLIIELQNDFNIEKQLLIDSKNITEEKQLLLNSLEDSNNEYRIIFAVDQLNEGWDVLNLFDIVRLYDTRSIVNNKIGPQTITEAQLIGRGARYCPFRTNDDQEFYKRKFDKDETNELRICERLYYHSKQNSQYIQELRQALRQKGIIAEHSHKEILKLKGSFKQTDLFKNGKIAVNKKIVNDNSEVFNLPSNIRLKDYSYNIPTNVVNEENLFEDAIKSEMVAEKKKQIFHITDFGEKVIRKAMAKIPAYSFEKLRIRFPNLKSVSQFIQEYLQDVEVTVQGTISQVNNLSAKQKLNIVLYVLNDITNELSQREVSFKGSKKFELKEIKYIFTDKELNFSDDESDNQEHGKSMIDTKSDYYLDLKNTDWYAFNDCFGTSEEKNLVKFINDRYQELKNKYDEVYLIRNERHFALYSFDDGRRFEPDFVLFLKNKQEENNLIYQFFIEPKGKHLFEHDKWKEDFLKQINATLTCQTDKYNIWGLPFFNKENNDNFNSEFRKILEEK